MATPSEDWAPYGSLQLCIAPVQNISCPLLASVGTRHAHNAETYMQGKIHTCIIIK